MFQLLKALEYVKFFFSFLFSFFKEFFLNNFEVSIVVWKVKSCELHNEVITQSISIWKNI